MELIDTLAAQHRCMFGSARASCGAPATIHVLLENGAPTMGCSEHAGWWNYHQHKDNHAIRPDCGMPGTYWFFSTPDAAGRCLVLVDEDVA